jgi:hypothetical protein
MNGQLTYYSEVGQQSIIRVTIPSNFSSGQPFVIIVEVRDHSGISTFLAWDTATTTPNDVYQFETVWMPTELCSSIVRGVACNANYQIRSFVISNSEEPQVLADIRTLDDITIVPAKQAEDNKAFDRYKLDLPDGEADIEYHIDTGQMSKVAASPKFSSINIMLEGVSSDGNLTITIPHDLLNLMHSTFSYHYGNATVNEISIAYLDKLPRVTIDDRFIEPASILATEKGYRWVIPVQSGSEKIEFVLGMVP